MRPEQCIVFYLRGGVKAVNPENQLVTQFPKTSINGPQLARFDYHLSPDYLMFSVDFQPGALSKFLRLPFTNEFINDRIDAEAILNPDTHDVHERMANARRYEDIVPIVETYLWQRIQCLKTDFQGIDYACYLITERPTAFSIPQLADKACLSVNQFERRFVQQVGISPKLFARTNRFYQAFQQLPVKPYPPSTEQCMYFYPFDLPQSIKAGSRAPERAASGNVMGSHSPG